MRKKGIDDLNSEISVSIVTPTTKQRKDMAGWPALLVVPFGLH